MLDVSKENFENEVLQAEGVIVVDFWGPKCAPCKALMPAMEELANKYGDRIKFCKLNTTENMRLAIAQKVSGLPTVIVYKDGKQIAQLTTDFDINDVENKLLELLAS